MESCRSGSSPRRTIPPALEVDELHRAQGAGHLDGHGVRVQAVGTALAVAAQRRDHRYNVVLQQGLEHADVDPFHAAGHLVVQSADDPCGMGHQGMAGSATEIDGGQTLDNLVRHPVGGGQGQLQRGRVGYPGAVGIGGRLAGLLGHGA